MKKNFKDITNEKLKYYVYVLTKVEKNKETIFYVGKGKNNRVFSHFQEAHKLKENDLSLTKKHKEILNHDVKSYIVKHGMDEQEALQYESSLIDLLNKFSFGPLTNLVRGFSKIQLFKNEIIESHAIDAVYSNPIDLEDFTKQNNLNITIIKINSPETYNSLLGKNMAWGIEMLWRTSIETIVGSDYILGVNHGRIFGVFKYSKNSIRELDNSNKNSINDFKNRIIFYEKNNYVREDLKKNFMDEKSNKRKYFELDTIVRPSIGDITIVEKKDNNKNILKEINNRNIMNKKIKGQNPVMKFWNKI